MTTVRTARAWLYKEQLREILERKQINVVRSMLEHWCTVSGRVTAPLREPAVADQRLIMAIRHGSSAS
jgi:hypothetical protein